MLRRARRGIQAPRRRRCGGRRHILDAIEMIWWTDLAPWKLCHAGGGFERRAFKRVLEPRVGGGLKVASCRVGHRMRWTSFRLAEEGPRGAQRPLSLPTLLSLRCLTSGQMSVLCISLRSRLCSRRRHAPTRPSTTTPLRPPARGRIALRPSLALRLPNAACRLGARGGGRAGGHSGHAISLWRARGQERSC